MPPTSSSSKSGLPMDRKVQGAFFLDYVRMMKRRKDVDWTKHLQPEDFTYLRREIDKSEWYPMGSFERMGLAILAEIASGKMDLVRVFGRAQAEELARENAEMVEGKPSESLVCFQMVRGSYFNFDAIHVQILSHNYAKLEIAYRMSPLAEQAACWQAFGYFERLLELAGATNINCRFSSRSWDGDAGTTLEIDWSNVTADRKVKGNVFLDYVRMIKTYRKVDWNRWLLPNDLLLLTDRIDVSGWYPMEAFERMVAGVLQEIAAGDLEQVRLWGRLSGSFLIKTHPDLISIGDPLETLYRFQVLRRSLFNFEAIDINSISSSYAKLHIDYEMGRATESAFSYQTLGFFEQLLESAGAQNLRSLFLSKSWEGDPTTILELKWN
jgi:hypothetical protein